MCVGKKVTSKVKRVMGSGSPSLSYNTPTRSLSNLLGSNQIPRKPKRKAKFEVAAQKYGTKKKGRSSTATFQKKLVVFQFMGTDAPKTFTRADKRICMRGLFPPIGVDCSESEIRAEICTAICTCTDPDLTDCGLDDFDFIDMNGKQAGIPKCKSGFEWDGRAVKELAGSGCIYVRLNKDVGCFEISNSSSDSDDLPPFPVSRTTAAPTAVSSCLTYTTNTTQPTSSHTLPQVTPTSHTLPQVTPTEVAHVSGPSMAGTSVASTSTSSHTLHVSVEKDDPSQSISKMVEMFPNMKEKQLEYLYDLSDHSFTRAVDCVLEGPSFESLRSLAYSHIDPTEECSRIRLDNDDDAEDWIQAALALYKQSKFNAHAGLQVSIRGQPGIDTGGVRRQFFSVVLTKLAQSSPPFCFFDGDPNRLRPAFKATTLSSGMMTTIGTMIAHSIVLDGQGFPFLAEYCFYYIAGCVDHAITCIGTEDVGADVAHILNKV